MFTRAMKDLACTSGEERIAVLQAMHTDLANAEGVNAYGPNLRVERSLSRRGAGSHGFCIPDLLVARNGAIYATEFNGDNAAITFPYRADAPRVQHMIDTLLWRKDCPADGAVILVPRSPDTSLGPEIKLRAVHMAVALRETTGVRTQVRDVCEPVPADGVTVVSGTIPQIVAHLERYGEMLLYRGVEVAFLNNQNILAALARQEGNTLATVLDELDPDLIHQGTGLAKVAMDKTLQQELADGTGITPVTSERTHGMEETVEMAFAMAQWFGGSVAKPDAASGGTSVVMVDARHTRDEIRSMLAAGAAKMQAKYGDGWEGTCPMAVYEFVDAMPAVRSDGKAFRWDMRFEVLARPNEITITPIIARTCPVPIGDLITPGSAMTNLTGRARGENERLSPSELCRRTGLDDSVFETIADGLRKWVANALAVGTRTPA